ncbi:hypothetical protein HDV63DRAFT_368894 [Trichoderma sp. SZMC 28014]
MAIVGDCEWIEIADLDGNASQGAASHRAGTSFSRIFESMTTYYQRRLLSSGFPSLSWSAAKDCLSHGTDEMGEEIGYNL